MPNGYHGSREGWSELEAPFVAADAIVERFARAHDAEVIKNSRNWPGPSVDRRDPIRRSVWVSLTDDDDARYDMGASASFDRDGKRYFRTEPLKDGVDWPEMVDDLEALLRHGFELACSWSEDDIPYALDLPQI